jgi:bifunctional non-homologous end joining protein LigD
VPAGIVYNEHLEGDGARHACRLGCEGIVSKRADSPYRSGHKGRLTEQAKVTLKA